MKIKTDTIFLSHSPLAFYFNFSDKHDPFLVYSSKYLDASEKYLLYISKSLLRRIRKAEAYILEETINHHLY